MENNSDKLLDVAQLEAELEREKHKKRYGRTLGSTVAVLITIAAISVLVATLWLPVLQIYGSSMTPTLEEGQIVVAVKHSDFEEGDVIAFYYGNKMLVKRYIAGPGSWVDIQDDGTVLVDGTTLNEPYISEKSLGECDLKFPYQVPEDRYFVLGDHRETSVDSRSSALGCVAEEQVVGKIYFSIWPLNKIGRIN